MKIVGLVLLFAGLVSVVQGIGAAPEFWSWSLLAGAVSHHGPGRRRLPAGHRQASMTRRARRFGKYLGLCPRAGRRVPEKAG